MAGQPSVSVVMPAYNVRDFIAEALASVLDQTWPDLEMIVVDDGSTDGTLARLDAARADWNLPGRELEIVAQKNAGAGAARNVGLSRASGEFVVFMDSDDRLHPDLVTRLVGCLREDSSADLVFPCHRYVNDLGEPIGFENAPRALRFHSVDLMIDNPIHSATGVVVRRSAVEQAGGFDASLASCIDLDLWVRIGHLRPGNIVAAGAVLADYRKRDGQITGNWRRMEAGWTRVREKLAEMGHPMTEEQIRLSRARRTLFWASIAYEAADYRAARRLIAETWVRDPAYAARTPLARIRTLACLASFLPRRVHDAVRRSHNRLHGRRR